MQIATNKVKANQSTIKVRVSWLQHEHPHLNRDLIVDPGLKIDRIQTHMHGMPSQSEKIQLRSKKLSYLPTNLSHLLITCQGK